MIINIRGTSGSGKSTLIRSIMEHYEEKEPHFIKGRKRPLYYLLTSPSSRKRLAVIGHYESPCGGCDTITSQDDIFQLVRDHHAAGHDVIFEGLLIGAEFNRTKALCDAHPGHVHIINLTTPLEDCVAGVQARRTARGDERPLNPKNTESKFKQVKRLKQRFEEAGIKVREGDRDEALALVEQILEIS